MIYGLLFPSEWTHVVLIVEESFIQSLGGCCQAGHVSISVMVISGLECDVWHAVGQLGRQSQSSASSFGTRQCGSTSNRAA